MIVITSLFLHGTLDQRQISIKLKFFKCLLLLIVCFGFYVLHANEIDFLENPQTCSEQQLPELIKEKTLDMCWNFGKDSHFRFISGNEEIYFEIGLGLLPEIYNDFHSSVRHKFIENKSGQLIFSYKINSCGCEEINKPLMRKKDGHPDDYSYIIADRRVLNDGQAKQIKQVGKR